MMLRTKALNIGDDIDEIEIELIPEEEASPSEPIPVEEPLPAIYPSEEPHTVPV